MTPQPSSATHCYPGLRNVVACHKAFYSGSATMVPTGFETFWSLGVKTIIRVDGATLDVKAAEARCTDGHRRPASCLYRLFASLLEALAGRIRLGGPLSGLVGLIPSGVAVSRVFGLWALGEPLGDTSASWLSFGGHGVVPWMSPEGWRLCGLPILSCGQHNGHGAVDPVSAQQLTALDRSIPWQLEVIWT
jgi:hypothetical protein